VEDPCDAVPTTDEGWVDYLLDDCASVDEVRYEVAWSGGWPVKTNAGNYLFVVDQDGGPWDIAGDFNGWTPSAMEHGNGFYWVEANVPSPEGGLYKFVSGDNYYADPWARCYDYDGYGERSYVEPPTDTGRLEWWPYMDAGSLYARGLRIYVPPGNGPWPVLYVHDGQNLFDPNAPFGEWQLDEWAAAYSDGGTPFLVVGIDNTGARMDEYTHVEDELSGATYGGLGDEYADFVQETVRPFIEAEYGSTGVDGVMGSSLGGLISLYIAHAYPGEFDFVASLSGTLGWGRFTLENPTIQELYIGAGVQSTVIYVDSGGDDGGDGCDDGDGDGFVEDDPNDSDNYCVNRAFADEMALFGYTWNVDLFHYHEPGAAHAEPAWADRVWRPLDIFVGLE
jgi:hypothetical protein